MFILIRNMLQFLNTHHIRRNIEASFLANVVLMSRLYHLEWFIDGSQLGINLQHAERHRFTNSAPVSW